MNWSAPVEAEHASVLKYIRTLRRGDIVRCIIFAFAGTVFLATGIYAVIDKFEYAFGFFIPAVFLFLISGGCLLTNADRYRIIRERGYEVERCRVISRQAYRSRYHTDREVTVLRSDGKQSNYKVTSLTYRNAKEGAVALLVDYTREHEGKRDIPIDMVIHVRAEN
ncbi:MAG: hypothetical protein K5779_03845 [Saccharofermentans sp.]|nr:hypothetical protein [Saccharofermentans sp.]